MPVPEFLKKIGVVDVTKSKIRSEKNGMSLSRRVLKKLFVVFFLVAVAYAFFEAESIQKARETHLRIALWILGLGAVLVFMAMRALRSEVIAPIRSLASAAKAVSKGEFTEVTKTGHNDEIGDLTASFNKMVRSVYTFFLNLRILEQEQLKIVGTMDIQNLSEQIQASVRAILKRNVNMRLHLCVPIDGVLDCEVSPAEQGFLRFKIRGAKQGGIVGFLDVHHPFTLEEGEEQESLVRMLMMSAGAAIENIRFAQEQQDRLRMQAELDTARLVQQSLIPPSQSLRFGRYEMASFFVSATECCGDWWNYYPLRDGRLLVVLGDVTGHGTSSALIASLAKGFCDSVYWRTHWTPADILADLNAVICASGADANPFMSMFVALIDPAEQSIVYASAGHPHPFVVHTNPAKPPYSRLLSVGPLLGWKCSSGEENRSRMKYTNKTFPFENGDILLVYSDGLLENPNHNDEVFLESSLRSLFKSKWGTTATELHRKIAEVRGLSSQSRLEDDMTFVALQLYENDTPVLMANHDSLKQKVFSGELFSVR